MNICSSKHDFLLKNQAEELAVVLAVKKKKACFFTPVKDICFGKSHTQLRSTLEYESTIC